MTGYDQQRVSRAVGAALAGPGGVGMVVKVFCAVPGVVHQPARRGFFRSEPERILIGDWRYQVTADGRLSAAHLVNGIVLAEEILAATAVGPHIAHALAKVVNHYGLTIVPSIDAAVEMLETFGVGGN
ncbi:hypothetical protein MB901379_02424 [Mycobacterium basiliense]|uniref:DUF5073 domain-containing protein n=1 Tax=Mycobacterium basiliense TaxID=2094119 RepID=A0A3S4FR09_9MYCO|nr:DUF5073 family protein [Mycobacterium basiliense]VDM88858.1 hypothetical protein MB901379_02424 [Mycobacterium basiliense]